MYGTQFIVKLYFILYFAGFILTKFEGYTLSNFQIRQIFCFIFIIILGSSVFVTPHAISSNYWPIAYAETNSTLVDETFNSTTNNIQNSTSISNSTIDVQYPNITNETETNQSLSTGEKFSHSNTTTSNYTSSLETVKSSYVNQTTPTEENLPSSDSTPADDVDTSVGVTTSPVIQNITISEKLEISTGVWTLINETSIIGRNQTSETYYNHSNGDDNFTAYNHYNSTSDNYTNSTSDNYTNSTSDNYTNSTSDNYTNSTNKTLTNTIFNVTLQDTLAISNILLEKNNKFVEPVMKLDIINAESVNGNNSQTQTTESLDTSQVVVNNSELNEELNAITVSAWINPDYHNGDAEFTVVSKEKSFILGVNNVVPPEKKATFSVFNGISWTTLTGNISVPNGTWTHLTGVIHDSEISLYQDSILLGTATLDEVFSMTDSGQLRPISSDAATDNSDIIIGAYHKLTTNGITSSKEFSGLIDDVEIYKRALDESEIFHLFADNTYSSQPTETTTVVTENKILIDKYQLQHSEIISGTPVTWSMEIQLSEQAKNFAIEIPDDAIILGVVVQDQAKTILFDESESITSLQNSMNIDELQIQTFDIIDSKDTQTIFDSSLNLAEGYVTINEQELLFAPLDLMPGLVEEGKPTKLILIKQLGSEFDLVFETKPLYNIEKNNSNDLEYDVQLTIGHESALHYEKVRVCEDLPEDAVEMGVEFQLELEIDGKITDVTDNPNYAVEFIDTNENEIVDQMCWVVPQLSEKTFHIKADLTVINVQSYPIVGGEWEVRFTTLGQADLEIMAVGGSGWSNVNENRDLKFLEIKCGNEILSYEWIAGMVVVPNYSCDDIGSETTRVLTTDTHHLQFKFGNDLEYAHNDANNLNVALVCGTGACADPNRDIPLRQHLEENHNVTPFDDNIRNWNTQPYHAIVISESVLSSNTEWLKDEEVGILTVEGHSYNELWLAKQGLSDDTGNPTITAIKITDNSHYITENFILDESVMIADATGNTGVMWDWETTIDGRPSGVKALAVFDNGAYRDRARLLIVEKGDKLLDDSEAVDRRVFFGARYFDNLNLVGKDIFDRALVWTATKESPEGLPEAPDNVVAQPGDEKIVLSWDEPEVDEVRQVIFSTSFETQAELDEWIIDTERTTATGKYNLELDDDSGRGGNPPGPHSGTTYLGGTGNFDPDFTAFNRNGIDISQFTDVEISVWYSSEDTEDADDFAMYYFGDPDWIPIFEISNEDLDVSPHQMPWTFVDQVKVPKSIDSLVLQFFWSTSSHNEHVMIDDLQITGIPIEGSSSITDYIIEFKESSNNVWNVFNDEISPKTTATVTNLSNDISYDFRIKAENSVGVGPPSVSVSATPTHINVPPIAGNDAFSTSQNTNLLISTTSLLANDFDLEGNILEIISIDSVTTHGGLVEVDGSNLIYSPPEDFSSPPYDTFTYTISDSDGSEDTATVTVTIIPEEIEETIELAPPELPPEQLDDLTNLGATVNGEQLTQENLPTLIVTNPDNDEVIDDTVEAQSSIQLNTALPSETTASDAIEQLSIPTYNIPIVSDIAVVLPATATSQAGAQNQFIATPVLDKIVGGQKLVLANDVISDFGGLSRLTVSPSVSSDTEESLVAVIAPEPFGDPIPPELQDSTSNIFIDIKTLFEEGVPDAYDWSQETNHSLPPEIEVTIQKPEIDLETGKTTIPVNSDTGCPLNVQGFFLDTVPEPDEWLKEGVIVDQSSIRPVNDTLCSVKVQLPHFSKFAIGGVKALALGALASGLGGGSVKVAPEIGDGTIMYIDEAAQGFGGIISENPIDSDNAIIIEPGQTLRMHVDVNERDGINNIQHVSLITNIRGDIIGVNGDTSITYEKDKSLAINDPHGIFSSVDFEILERDTHNFVLLYEITFAKEMDTSHIFVQVWDLARNLDTKKYENAIKVAYPEEPINQETEILAPQIPNWLKSSAQWWLEEQISDSEFTEGLEYLINEGIIEVSSTEVNSNSEEIPSWIENNAQWWINGQISEDDFVTGIQWMVSNGIISINHS